VVLGLLGGNVYCMSEVAMYVVVCFWWQCELLGVLSGNVYCWVFQLAMCVPRSFRWQCVVFLVGNVSS